MLDAVTAYGEAFAKVSNYRNARNQLRRGIAAYSARKTTEAVSALTSIPTSAGEVRAGSTFISRTDVRSSTPVGTSTRYS